MSDNDRDVRRRLNEAPADRRPAKAASIPPIWEHAPAPPGRGVATGGARPQGAYRGRGPRGYVRSPARIYEDLCDRLTENPFIDASDIEVTIAGTEVTLSGTVRDVIAMRQAHAIAEEVAGVTHVHNRMQIRDAAEPETTPGKSVNEALGTGEEP